MPDSESENARELSRSLYDALHEIATRELRRERPGHSMQPTLLVHDAYMRLLQQRNIDQGRRTAVLAAGAKIIRRLLVDYARARKAQKRGGEHGRAVPLSVSLAEERDGLNMVDLHESLELLEKEHARASMVVELRFFGGLTWEEIGAELQVSAGTVSNDWKYAKAWLYRAMGV